MTAAEYAALLTLALKPMLRTIRQLFHLDGVPVTPAQQAQMAYSLLKVTDKARQKTFKAGVAYLKTEGIKTFPDLPRYPIQAPEKVLDRVIGGLQVSGQSVTESIRHETQAIEAAQKAVGRGLSRHAQEPARQLVKEVADDASGHIGWARMLTGATSCAFCAMLASRGPVYSSSRAALQRGSASVDTYHDGCDCIAVLVRDFDTWEGRESYARLEDLWADSTTKTYGKDSLNAFRRAWSAKVKDGSSTDFMSTSMSPGGAKLITPGG
jgi:hypothetical protein